MNKLFFTLLFSVLLLSAARAQSTLGFNLNAFLPYGELKQDSPEIWGGGFSTDVAVQMKNSPIHLGGILDFTRYGSEVRDGWHGPALGDVRVRRNNSYASLLGLVRVKPPTTVGVQPYIDFMAGFSYIFTTSHFRDSAFEEAWDTVLDYDDFVMNYGLGGGIEVFLNNYLSFDVNIKAVQSGRAQYLTPESVSYDREAESYHMIVKDSRFNRINFGIGVKVLLSHIE